MGVGSTTAEAHHELDAVRRRSCAYCYGRLSGDNPHPSVIALFQQCHASCHDPNRAPGER
jgi:hypothetical protein